jgi:hypothetical protein
VEQCAGVSRAGHLHRALDARVERPGQFHQVCAKLLRSPAACGSRSGPDDNACRAVSKLRILTFVVQGIEERPRNCVVRLAH